MVKERRYVYFPACVRHSAEQVIQVHLLEDGTIAVFSRNSENMSAKYPDLVEQVPRVSVWLSTDVQFLQLSVHKAFREKLCDR